MLRRPGDLRNERLLPMRVDVEWTRALLGLERGSTVPAQSVPSLTSKPTPPTACR